MKQFAFPFSVKCASAEERDECLNLLESIGYKTKDIDDLLYVANCYLGGMGVCSTIINHAKYDNNRHHIDHFNPELIRDIARVCSNDTWQKDEVVISMGHLYCPYEFFYEIVGKSYHENLKYFRRPTLAEICEHHGYEIKGRDIVKKEEKISEPDDSHAFIAEKMKEIYLSLKELNNLRTTAEINRLKAENAELKEKLEAVAEVVNQELERLRNENAELKKHTRFTSELTNEFDGGYFITFENKEDQCIEIACCGKGKFEKVLKALHD